MRHIAVIVALLATGSSIAFGQQPPSPVKRQAPPHAAPKPPVLSSWPLEGTNGTGSYLLSRKDVQGDLKLSADASARVDALCAKLKSDVAADQAAYKAKQKPAETIPQLYAAANQQLTALLDKGQNDRLRQIFLQQRGVEAFIFPDVQQEVGLQAQQVSQLDSILASRRDAIKQLNADLKSGKITKDQFNTQLRAGNVEFYKSMNAVITPDQHKKLTDLLAPRFKATKA